MLDFGAAAYFVSIPLLFGGVIFGHESMTLSGAALTLVSIAVITAA